MKKVLKKKEVDVAKAIDKIVISIHRDIDILHTAIKMLLVKLGAKIVKGKPKKEKPKKKVNKCRVKKHK